MKISQMLIIYLCLAVNIAVYAQPCASKEDQNNVLLEMVSLGHQAGVEQLLATGRYDVNYVNDNGDTGLSIAVRRNDLEMMQFLVSSGADINIGMGREHLISTAQLHGNQEMLIQLEKTKESLN